MSAMAFCPFNVSSMRIFAPPKYIVPDDGVPFAPSFAVTLALN
jgi:hypothetical protein